jgi:hypothetical protein
MRSAGKAIQDLVDLVEERVHGVGKGRQRFVIASMNLPTSLDVIGEEKRAERAKRVP